jgi:hypothetical protein
MQHRPSCGGSDCSPSPRIPFRLWNWTVRYHVQKFRHLTLDQTNSVHNLTSHFRFHLNTTTPPPPTTVKIHKYIQRKDQSFQQFLYSSLLVTLAYNKEKHHKRHNCLVVTYGIKMLARLTKIFNKMKMWHFIMAEMYKTIFCDRELCTSNDPI